MTRRWFHQSPDERARQKAMEAFLSAAHALCGYDPDGVTAAILYGSLGLVRLMPLCTHAVIEKAMAVVRDAQEGRSAS